MARPELHQIIDGDGRPLDARFGVERVNGVTTVFFASRNKERNTDYNRGMNVLLSRLRDLGAQIVDGFVEARGTERLSETKRRVHVGSFRYPIPLATVRDVNALRVAFCKALAFTANASKKKGNMQRSCRIHFEVDSTVISDAELEEFLTFGVSADDAAGPPNDGRARTEGGRRVVISRQPERDRSLRNEAIRIHGSRCGVCTFDFGEFYGTWGEGFAEVHHVTPLGSSKKKRETNPATDLVVLCANCHRMVHRRRGICLTINELREKVRHTAAASWLERLTDVLRQSRVGKAVTDGGQ